MRLFFIDYENTASEGTRGISSINSDDVIYLFYTRNSSTLDFALFREFQRLRGKYELIEVLPGSNSLDFQLSSYLGSLIPSHTCDSFYIVSKDKGFDSVVSFWQKRSVDISRVNNMQQLSNAIVQELSSKLPEYRDTAFDIVELLNSCKTKQGLNSALVKKYGSSAAGIIYKQLKPYIKDFQAS